MNKKHKKKDFKRELRKVLDTRPEFPKTGIWKDFMKQPPPKQLSLFSSQDTPLVF